MAEQMVARMALMKVGWMVVLLEYLMATKRAYQWELCLENLMV